MEICETHVYIIGIASFFLSPQNNPENICFQIEKGFHITEKFLTHALSGVACTHLEDQKAKNTIFNKFRIFDESMECARRVQAPGQEAIKKGLPWEVQRRNLKSLQSAGKPLQSKHHNAPGMLGDSNLKERRYD